MKRDMDLIRETLLKIEEHPDYDVGGDLPPIEGYTQVEIYYHTWLLYDAGLIDAHDASAVSDFVWFPKRITWQGYEFLEAARDRSRWNKVKQMVLDRTGSIAFKLLESALIEYVKNQISSP